MIDSKYEGAYVSPGIGRHIRELMDKIKNDGMYKMTSNYYINMSNIEFSEILKDDYHIELSDINKISNEQRVALAVNLYKHTYRKIGNIVGFLETKENRSYTNTRTYSRDILKGCYDDIYALTAIMLRVGWNKGSGMSVAQENTSFNRYVDKEAIDIAKEVMKVAKVDNIDRYDFPLSGLVLTIQILRLLKWERNDIVKASKERLLHEEALRELNLKVPKCLGAVQAERIIRRNFNSHDFNEKLGWD